MNKFMVISRVRIYKNSWRKNWVVKKTHSSNLEDHEVKAVKEHFIPSAKKTSETPAINNVRTASHNIEMGQELPGKST